jgi:hypothetical protein
MAGSTKETPQQSLQQRLEAARQAASTARAHLDSLESRLQVAIREERFGDAHQIKQDLPDAEQQWAHAAADQRSIETVLDDLARQQAQRQTAEAAELRKQAATGNLNEAAVREQQGMEELHAAKAELIAGVGAVQDTINRAYAIEQQVRQARADKQQARVDLGELAAGAHVPAPNLVSAWVERSATLTAIKYGKAFPG